MLNAVFNKGVQFRRNEDGTLIIFGLVLFVLMVMMGGFAVDLMRYENTRTNLQNTLDRSVLAAASLTNSQSPDAVVRDYVLKAGLHDELCSVAVSQSLNSRTVRATGCADTHPMFLHMLGIESFDAKALSQAEQAITNVEIVLVLDVSGSMGQNSKIDNLKVAATDFVDTILDNDPQHRVSIAIVPYNAQVNVGPDMAAKFTVPNPNHVANVNCFEPERGTFTASLPISRTAPLSMTAYADYAYNTSYVNGYVAPNDPTYALPNYSNVYCKPSTVNVVRLPSNDGDTIKAQINALQAQGNTSITLGMKWGATMLDPSMRSAYAEFIGEGKMDAAQPNRPFDYNDPESMKFVILMTDGEHVSHNRVVDIYKSGDSNIYKGTDGKYSVHFTSGRPPVAGANQYYVPHLGTWQSTPWNNGVVQDWRDVWADLKVSYVAWQFFARALGTDNTSRNTVFNNTYNAMVQTYAPAADMDVSLNETCTFAKENGVTIYGIAFEAPAVGQTAIRNCSTDPETGSHYFAADGTGISSAFQAIAANMSMLKLTQ